MPKPRRTEQVFLFNQFRGSLLCKCALGFVVTHMEAQKGVLDISDAAKHCLAYVRTLPGLNKSDIWAMAPYVDTHGMRIDLRYQSCINELRELVLKALPDGNKRVFEVPFAEFVRLKPEDYATNAYLRMLVADVSSKLMDLVRNAAAEQRHAREPLEDEVLSHLRLSRKLVEVSAFSFE